MSLLLSKNTLITIVAVAVSIVGNFINAVGYIMEKQAHVKLQQENAHLPKEERKTYVKDCYWISGFSTYAFGSILHAIALAYGPQTLLTPLESVTLVSNTFLANKYLHEPLRKQDIFGTILVVIGCVLCVVFGPSTDDKELNVNIKDFQKGASIEFSVFFGVLSVIIIIDWMFVKIIEQKNSVLDKKARNAIKNSFPPHISTNYYSDDSELSEEEEISNLSQINTNNQEAEAREASKVINDKIYKGRTFLMLSYTTIGAYFGALNILLTKSTFEIIISMFDSFNNTILALLSPMTYILIISFILGNILMEYWKQKALKRFGALYVIPIYQVEVIVGGILFGAVYFNELNYLSLYDLFLFILAIVINLIGVSVLASSIGIKQHIKFHNIVRRKLLVMKAINALLSVTNHIKYNKHKEGIFIDDYHDISTMNKIISRENRKLDTLRDLEIFNNGTGANDLHAMQTINDENQLEAINGLLAPVIKYVMSPHYKYNIKQRYNNNKYISPELVSSNNDVNDNNDIESPVSISDLNLNNCITIK